jgi:hypothetical protein
MPAYVGRCLCASSRQYVEPAPLQIFAHIRNERADRRDRRFKLHCWPSEFPHPMPHFSGRGDIDTCVIGWAEQAGVVRDDGHCSKAAATIASKASAGTTTGGTNQATIC